MKLEIDGLRISADRTSEVDRSVRAAGVRGREAGRAAFAESGLKGLECGPEREMTGCTPPCGSAEERLVADGTGVGLLLLAQLGLVSEWLA